jgi:hypothetical protein
MPKRKRSQERVKMEHAPTPPSRSTGGKTVVVYANDEFTIKGRMSVEEAIKRILLNKARIPHYGVVKGKFFQGPPTPDGGRFKIEWPAIIVENDFHYVPPEHLSPVDDILAARMAILRRDDFICQYCGEYGNTIDHVFPESRGGENTWWNLATACVDCNGKKADRTPEEAGMKLFREPFIPKETGRQASEVKAISRLLEKNTLRVTND